MSKPAFCIWENKNTDQQHSYSTADQHLCFCYIDSTVPLIPKSETSSLYPSSVVVQPDLRLTWSETLKTGILVLRLKYETYLQNKSIIEYR